MAPHATSADSSSLSPPVRVVIVGNGPVGHRFLEDVLELDSEKRFQLTSICEEKRHAYNRVQLTSYFKHHDPDQLSLCGSSWFGEHNVAFHISCRAVKVNREAHTVETSDGRYIAYDKLVLATGSYAFVPALGNLDQCAKGLFVYRTLDDTEAIVEYIKSGRVRRAAAIGGGLLGLEAAKALYDMRVETHVMEHNPYLMPRQLDATGGKMLVDMIKRLGIHVELNWRTQDLLLDDGGSLRGLRLKNKASGEMWEFECDMLVVCAGIRPRDELGRNCGIELGAQGGIKVDDHMRTSDPDIYAIGEVASHRGKMTYGLVAPGWEMSKVLVSNLTGVNPDAAYTGSDLSTKLKLLGVDVASFGHSDDFWFKNQFKTDDATKAVSLTQADPFLGHYKKLVFNPTGDFLLGGMLVGDVSDYTRLLSAAKRGHLNGKSPAELMGFGGAGEKKTDGGLDDADVVCTCFGITKGDIDSAVKDKGVSTLEQLKKTTKCGTGCGGCIVTGPVKKILADALKKMGKDAFSGICSHFPLTRKQLFDVVKIKGLKSYKEIFDHVGKGDPKGCETCKPAIASILASLWNEHILASSRDVLQDTNDRFLANIQRSGTYSVIPRIPGGEITPAGLRVIADVGVKYGLYTKITGGQRIDLFGAAVQDLPQIWEELVDAGFESGHAYAKSLRTVKSCVGSTWCRYGQQDSVGMAILLENRYKGLRSPHKLKGGVSGCVRECAEAQGKDFGLIATDKGYNLYVCGNGGARPAHAKLLASDVDEATAIKYLDRFLMFYIYTADPLQRTAPWLENLEGGLDHLKQVVIDDKLGLAEELEQRMEYVIDTYKCEWKEVVDNPKLRARFSQFANTTDKDQGMSDQSVRGQSYPVPWPETGPWEAEVSKDTSTDVKQWQWTDVGTVDDFPLNGGAAVKVGDTQLAVFRVSKGDEGDRWFATQNMCPHKRAFVLSRGLIGEHQGEPKVACPFHKKTFSLETGACLSGDPYKIAAFDVKIDGGRVSLHLPPTQELDKALATSRWRVTGGESNPQSGGGSPKILDTFGEDGGKCGTQQQQEGACGGKLNW
ncbi:unnamed protein product [Vitrella brassicaformis CCMP3155]|uniref:Rieske domain-containing protein n=3 Tax=Vitrella brassicaformis TaxID=1169539 RepID=A0A0G4GXP7_VITBC|nr:unnamed protein product [Vitrella brassicaformis CCMP3155]|mmetsp:Transcript_45059/g.127189  ORF Transcript_45059/g.127189 Transcript_45059/m.127189 type:complete len:1062 (-) Transcript_45059:283-3468(-)|eukprot:CEM35628.1 unnamed protein product [Vitrella brassicaformis CCMP3155]